MAHNNIICSSNYGQFLNCDVIGGGGGGGNFEIHQHMELIQRHSF